MSLTPDIDDDAGERLLLLNDGAYDPSRNPFGLGRGGNSRGVFVGAMRDFIIYARGAVAFISGQVAAVRAIADRFDAAVEAIEEGPVTSVNGQTGPVVIDLSTISADVEAQLAEVAAAQAQLAASNAAIRSNANAYSLAFGG